MEYLIINIIITIAIIIMAMIAKENYKGEKRTFKKDGKLKTDKIIFYIILYIIAFQFVAAPIATLVVYMCCSIFKVPAGIDGLAFVVNIFGLAVIALIYPNHRLVKYIVLAFPK